MHHQLKLPLGHVSCARASDPTVAVRHAFWGDKKFEQICLEKFPSRTVFGATLRCIGTNFFHVFLLPLPLLKKIVIVLGQCG